MDIDKMKGLVRFAALPADMGIQMANELTEGIVGHPVAPHTPPSKMLEDTIELFR